MLDYIAKDFNHNLVAGGEHFHEYVNELFGREKVKKLFTVGECSADEKSIQDLCGETRGELKCSFQFEHIGLGRVNKYTPKPHSVFDTAKVLKNGRNFLKIKIFYIRCLRIITISRGTTLGWGTIKSIAMKAQPC